MTSLPVLARFADTDVDALKELNPELLRATTPPGPYLLRVPPGQSGVTARALARIPASQRLDFQAYRIRRGDSLARLAARFNLSVEDLLDANSMTRAQFRAGRVIHVPPPPASPIDDRDLLSKVDRARSSRTSPWRTCRPSRLRPRFRPWTRSGTTAPPRYRKPSAPFPPLPRLPHPRPRRGAPAPVRVAPAGRPVRPGRRPRIRPAFHVVKRGETLFAIAERYGLDLKELAPEQAQARHPGGGPAPAPAPLTPPAAARAGWKGRGHVENFCLLRGGKVAFLLLPPGL